MLAAFAGQLDRRLPIAIVGSAVLATLAVASIRAPAAQAADADTPVQLRTTSQFAVLAGAGITNTGTTTIQGDIGSFPTTDQTISGVTLDGTNQAGNAVTQQAKRDLVAAYDEAAGALPPTSVETELGGKTLVGGVYKAATELGLTGTLTLDGGRSDGLPSNKVFIFQAGTTLITEVDSEVVLTGGAQACNIFWQVGSAATFKTRTAFRGTVMAYTGAITAQQGATFVGRLLARDSAVTMDNNTISRPSCVVGPDGADADGTDGTDADTGADADGTDGTDADTGADADGTDGTDADTGADADGTDGTDADTGADADGTDGTIADVDADAEGTPSTDGDAVASTSDGNSTVELPDSGGPTLWLLAAAAAFMLTGTTMMRRSRYRPAHAAR